MSKYTLTKEDIQDINILIDLGMSIKENEEKLIALEIQGQKQSSEYTSTLECIRSTLFLENSVLTRIGTNPEKIIAIISHLMFDPTQIMEIDKQLKVIANGASRDLIIQRIALRLNETMINNKNNLEQTSSPLTKNYIIASLKTVKMNLAIKNDLISTILIILNQEIHNSTNSIEVRNYLTRIKYYIAFVFKNIENDLINNNFEPNDKAYWTSETYAKHLGISKDKYQPYAISYSNNTLISSMKFILELTGYELGKAENASLLKLHEIFIRASILLSPPEITTQVKESVMKQFTVNKIMYRDTKSCQLLLSILDRIANDRTLIQTITFTLKRESN